MQRITVALDVMGGDNGPRSILPAISTAIESHPNLTLVICGDKPTIERFLLQEGLNYHPRIAVEACEQVVEMTDKPAAALRQKKQSSMYRAIRLVADGKADACVSAGNTGALLAMGYFVLKTLPKIDRPALVASMPTVRPHRPVHILDLGANVSCGEEALFQFAVMGSVMAEQVEGIYQPRVALLNMGVEEIKGNAEVKACAQRLSKIHQLNYVGYVEGSDLFSAKADVIVCDGFVGNVALKTSEGIAKFVLEKLKALLEKNVFTRAAGYFLTPAFKSLYSRMNPDQYNGACLIGLRGIVVKSHGNASHNAFYQAIVQAMTMAEKQVPEKIKDKIETVLSNRA